MGVILVGLLLIFISWFVMFVLSKGDLMTIICGFAIVIGTLLIEAELKHNETTRLELRDNYNKYFK